MVKAKIWWFSLLVTLFSSTIIVDHLLPASTQHVTVLSERDYQERVGSHHNRWDFAEHQPTTINAIILRLSDGTFLQLSSLGDFISTGDTIEIQRTPLLNEPLQYRKTSSRARNWLVVDTNKLDYRIFPYLVFVGSFLLLFPWPEDYFRWSLQTGLGLMLVCWLVILVGTGGLGRLLQWF